ncbi:PEPxxWA-CTERM sorting domain-containing protein [Sphingomonas sp. SM33]|uniref:PEPxxWA-CTERM sorting domain-containing protein n=1 Tax=Sphingomonas telluris TaxID=2907998 RepID=A0ABS9VRM7_9SPHN|nr:PEPxxWA-CTERM sorting domain-containing protein [Sphingomonas telluris]MCH8617463.1 PEPxxWA-CTERM sorting domain-containing protein [Sphingomonas telluris]
MRNLVRTVVAGILLGTGLPANADVLPFTGSVTGLSALVGADATCAPLQFRSVIDPSTTNGTSSLGDFTYGTSTCLSLGGGASFGTFIIDFGNDAFNGTFDGGSTPTDTVGISNTAWLFTILGGTGRFEGASGTFNGSGIADARTRPTHVSIDFIGNVNAPAVPEPTTWSLMLLGFGATGLAVRRQRKRLRQQFA